MKIAIVSGDDVNGEDPERLGAALADEGHDATVCLRRAGGRRTETFVDGCRRVSVPVGPRTATLPADVLPYVGEWAAKLDRMWSTEQPDVVHAFGWLGGLAAQLAARRRHIPVVQTFHGLAATSRGQAGTEHQTERERLEPLLARSASWVTGESSDDVDALARLRRRRTRVSALTCGVDAERYTPTGPMASRNGLQRILYVTPNPLWCNGIDIAIRALPKVRGAELVIAENDATNEDHDEARTRLRNLAAELGVADRVRFDGTVADDELPKLIRSADVVAFTPRRPPRAGAVLQAMSSGVVVVVANVGVLADVVLDDITGLVVPPENPVGLAAALRKLLAQSFQRQSMGAAGRTRAQSRFAWQRIALDALNTYRSVGSQGRAPVGTAAR
ncbi:glycosyltransferase [Mycobacterium mantenii]|uniref:Glycosyl transferase family 1 n=1 Tax=Mycobacterium mantenii TaxID=560555 RepID=A0A1A2TCP2_MYCNT|nr:glycosyltransferase [Mycobacterium mantenii]OBH41825.1 glycosyl transferase family 1 [Mycobacterium mantenii]OBH53910.1 glycosyl transferase family 1 [Mycobacterium mantenii]OBH74150.1 glycosyl transferase family 1 [Mycobacterium mantenii]OBH78312.1 glycosyl transferase family 1 [Mycobacterium mantenii]